MVADGSTGDEHMALRSAETVPHSPLSILAIEKISL
jgi:hypothetical protein